MADYSQDVVAKARDFDPSSAAAKTRVHVLAKSLGLTSKETIEALGHAGIVVKSASSTVNQNQLEAVLKFITDTADKPTESPSALLADDAKAVTDAEPKNAPKADESDKHAESSAAEEADADSKPAKKAAKKKASKKTEKKATAKKTAKRAAKRSVKKDSDNAQESKDSQEQQKEERNTDEAVEAAVSEAESEAKRSEEPSQQRAQERSEKAPVRSRRRRARRSSSGDEKVEIVEFRPEKVDELHDVEPPMTPEPKKSSDEQATYAPIFLAPQAAPVSASAQDDDDVEGQEPSASESGSDRNDTDRDRLDERQPRPRRRRRGRGRRRDETGGEESSRASQDASEAPAEEPEQVDEPQAIKGSTRLEAQRRRRNERREESRKRHVISEAEFLARRESVERTMVVRERGRHDHAGIVTEVGVLEDDLLVEHFVTSDTQTTQIGNIYLGRVQNVLPSMEAAFVDIGTDRNGVIYVGDLNWKLMGVKSRSRKIEHALKAGDQILVQVTKDPIGHKGARLTTHISMAGRFLVYVPGGRSAGISRKLPEPERKRLKEILADVTPEGSGTIIRTAAEGVSKEAIEADIQRLEKQWQDIFDGAEKAKAKRGAKPITLYEEPDMLVKVVRDVFNEDFTRLVVEGDRPWNTVTDYIGDLAPELESRLQRYFAKEHGGADVFEHFRIDEQLAKALDRKVWLPSGGTLVIDRTEAMTVIDVNTGKFTGSGGNLEETVTKNNLEAAEEIVRQMRLRDLGGMIVVDFIDMVLPENQDLVLRRLKEALGRDRSRHEVSEVTSLGLVQMTRKRLGTGLLETFSTPCSCCNGRGLVIHIDPVEHDQNGSQRRGEGKKRRGKSGEHAPGQHPAALAMHRAHDSEEHAEASEGAKGKASKKNSSLSDDSVAETRALQEKAAAEQASSEERVAAAVEAVVVSSEKEEPKPPRRRSRRGRGRGRRDEERVEDKRAKRNEASGVDADYDAGDDLAAVAAAAVAEARDKDPEEPSDDRYVAQRPRQHRRATRRRVAEHVAVDAAAQDSEDAEFQPRRERRRKQAGSEERAAEALRSDESAGGGRRRSRRARRVSRRSEVDQLGSGKDTAVDHAVDNAETVKSEKAGKSGKTEPAKSYEEAVEEFERSPRRRRPTRGNSRSDRAPRKEDFDSPVSSAKQSQPNNRKAAEEREASEEQTVGVEERAGFSHRRRRRGAVRTSPARKATRGQSDADSSESKLGNKQRRTEPETVEKASESEATSSRRRGGRTRRAVRKTLR